jgi:UDP-N-acetylglucosamine 2-epimerase (non-hydrolysing)
MKVLSIFGTRPEAIKMAPLVVNLKKNPQINSVVCVTGQHREMLDQVLDLFEITPDYDLNVMKKNQSLSEVTSRIITNLSPILDEVKPDLILVHGDTTTTFSAALSGFYHQVSVGHVEAGLRTGNIFSPWPEEANRKLVSCVTEMHFAPTKQAMVNLKQENIDESKIIVTGNTVIDALVMIKDKIESDADLQNSLGENFPFIEEGKRIVLVTGHRRENFGQGFENICESLKLLAIKNKDVNFVYPVHLNPRVREPVNQLLSNIDNIHLIEPQGYLEFVYLMINSYIILTDSGGIQEEAPALGKPVVVMRDTTERPEAVSAGTVVLVGTDKNKIIDAIDILLNNESKYRKMSMSHNPYGDGTASQKIIQQIIDKMGDMND